MRGVVRWASATSTSSTRAVLLCLHGRNNDHTYAFEHIGLHRFVAASQLPWMVVGVDGGSDSYWHARATGVDPQRMLFTELLPQVLRQTGDVPIAVMGWSMGGYGVLLAAADHPGEVAAVCAASPALWSSYAQAAPGAFDDAGDFARYDLRRRVDTLRSLRVRIDCGEDDPFLAADRGLANLLPDAISDFGPGFHEAASWRARVPAQLTFLQTALPG